MYGTPLIIGCDSRIGQELFDYFKRRSANVVGTSRRVGSPHLRLDLESELPLFRFPDSVGLAYLCTGITKVNACEEDPVGSHYINVERTQMLIHELLAQGVYVVFLSSDLATTSRSQYAVQKLAIEKYLEGKNATIVRLGAVITAKSGRLRNWVRELEAGRPIEPYHDYYFSPVSLENVLRILGNEEMLGAHSKILICGSESLSYFDAIEFIAEIRGLDRSLITSKASNIPMVESFVPDVDLKEFCFSSRDTLTDIFAGHVACHEYS